MNWSTFYLVCFGVGFTLSVLSSVFGALHLHLPLKWHFPAGPHVGHAGAGAGGHGGSGMKGRTLNMPAVMTFLAWFGAAGYLLTRYSRAAVAVTFLLATLAGLAGAMIVVWFLVRVLMPHERILDAADFRLEGHLARVTLPIRASGTGEIVYSQDGVRRSLGARSENGDAIARGAEVVIARTHKGIAYVRRWEDSGTLRGMRRRSRREDFQPLDTWERLKKERRMLQNLPVVAVIVGLVVLGTLFVLALLAQMFRKAGPHEALVVYGFRGTRIVKGGGTIIFPMVETWRQLSLELMSFDVAPQQDLYTVQGVAVTVEAVAQIKVKSDPESIQTASEQFLTKSPDQREGLIRLVMEGHLRGIIGQLTVEQIVKEPEMVADRMRSTCADDMNKMGLEVVSFTIKEVRDKNEYIANMGRPDVARIKRDADVAAAEADRDTAIKRAEATRASAIAKAQADQERVAAETSSLAKQAEAQRDLDIKKAAFLESTKKAQAQADKAYEIETNVMQQQVIAESVRVQQVEKEGQIKVQDAEIARREKELIATVLKQAEVERQKIETLASAEKQRLMSEAEGHAASIRAQGEAEAEILFKKGEAEAKAMNVKAEAYQEYNQVAIVDKLLTSLPEVVRAIATPLASVDRVTIVSTGNGDSAGAYKLTGDVAKIAAQVPALFEALSGMQMSDLLAKVRVIGDAAPKPLPAAPPPNPPSAPPASPAR